MKLLAISSSSNGIVFTKRITSLLVTMRNYLNLIGMSKT